MAFSLLNFTIYLATGAAGGVAGCPAGAGAAGGVPFGGVVAPGAPGGVAVVVAKFSGDA